MCDSRRCGNSNPVPLVYSKVVAVSFIHDGRCFTYEGNFVLIIVNICYVVFHDFVDISSTRHELI